jgi:replication factor A1
VAEQQQDPIDRILDDLKKKELNISRNDIATRYSLLVDNFKVRPAEAMRTTISYFCKEAGIAPAARGQMVTAVVEDVAYGGMWLEMDAKCVKLFDPKNKAIRQVGILGDKTGLLRFTMWAKADKLPLLEEGKSYHFKGLASDEYNGKFSVKLSKATKITVIADIESMEYTGSGDTVDMKVAEIKEAGTWLNLEVKCVQIWESTNDVVDQSGLIGDETGTIKFTKWTKSCIKEKFEEGKSYRIENVVADEYNGKLSVKLNKNSVIKLLDRDIEAAFTEVEFIGAIVSVSDKNCGLIKRCPICKAVLQKNVCVKHGKVNGTPDLRLLTSIDDGKSVLTLLLKREQTENILGNSLEDLRRMTAEALDPRLTVDMAEFMLLGRYFKVKGPQMDDLIVASVVESV